MSAAALDRTESRATAPGAELRAFTFDAPEVTPELFVRAAGEASSFVFAPPDGPALAAAGIARLLHTPAPDPSACGAADIPPEARAFCVFPFPDPRSAERPLERGLTLLPRWQLAVEAGRARATLLLPRAEAPRAAEEWSRLCARLEQLQRSPAPAPLPRVLSRSSPTVPYREGVSAALRAFASGELTKVVLSRRTRLLLAGPPDPLALLAALAAESGYSCRVAVQHEGAAFVAATPERLVRVSGRRVETEALAGTADLSLSDGAGLRASSKDLEEHAMVVRDLAARLRPLTSRLLVPAQPGTRALRHVLHLHSPISGELATAQHALELAALLFPTPAVCGLPRELALAWIQRHEEAPRGLYAGLVGWFDGRGDGDFWVGLRSAHISGAAVEQRVGAGLVAGSDPDGELAETEAKQRGLLRALGALP